MNYPSMPDKKIENPENFMFPYFRKSGVYVWDDCSKKNNRQKNNWIFYILKKYQNKKQNDCKMCPEKHSNSFPIP